MVSEIKFVKVKNVKSPTRGTEQSAGIDFFIPDEFETMVLLPGESCFIASGIKVSLPTGHVLIAFNKSGIAVKKKLNQKTYTRKNLKEVMVASEVLEQNNC